MEKLVIMEAPVNITLEKVAAALKAVGINCRIENVSGEEKAEPKKRTGVVSDAELKAQVSEILADIGVPRHIKGYRYLRESIVLAVRDMDIINAVTKALYPAVAKTYDTTASRVERAIRHAIEVAWDRGDLETLQKYFGYSISNAKGKPTNSEFIALIADQLLLENSQG